VVRPRRRSASHDQRIRPASHRGVLLAIGGFQFNYWFVLPGLVAYGAGLAIVLTVNDPVSLSDVPDADHGQAAGVSATAEQFGGALGIAVLYLIFHTTYVAQLHAIIDRGPLADLDAAQYARLRDDLVAAESTGLKPRLFDPLLALIWMPPAPQPLGDTPLRFSVSRCSASPA
jgi:hypothetical protein